MTPTSLTTARAAKDIAVLNRFAACLEEADGFSDALDVLHEAVGSFGFPLLAYAYMPIARRASGSWALAKLHTRNLPRRWDVQWDKHGVNDPYYHRCFEASLPVDWADVQHDESLCAAQRDCVRYISDHVGDYGLTVPIHLPGNQFAFVSILAENGTNWRQKVEQSRDSLFLMSHYFHSSLARKHRLPRIREVQELSEREIECLSWSAQGKTATDTAVILGISPETVRMYLKRINQKLNTLNRSHAVAKASLLGLIEIS